MIRIGLTGSIGMGKTTTAKMFADMGIPGFDADQAVHKLYSKNASGTKAIQQLFPNVILEQMVDRKALANHLGQHPEDFKALENLIHPLVAKQRNKWVEKQKTSGHEIVLFDIPLLLENQGEQTVDYVVLVTAPKNIQQKRVLARSGMTAEKFEQILNHQMPDEQKRKRAHYIIETQRGIRDTQMQVAAVLRHIKQQIKH